MILAASYSKILERRLTLIVSSIGILFASGVLGANAVDRTEQTGSGAELAGEATVYNRTSSAFEEASPNLSQQGVLDHDLGDEAFEESFVSTSDDVSTGLGPVFNNVSCVSCHIRNGRGMPVAGQLLLRVGEPEEGSTLSADMAEHVSNLGAQIQDFSIVGTKPEATVNIEWVEQAGEYPDGKPYNLRYPRFAIQLASNGMPLPDSITVSPRVPPAVFGLGLLEAISEEDILALADPDDENGDGISGRPNRVLNVQTNELQLGRFGWKANSPTLLQQSAEAYVNDMGIHSSLYPAADGSTELDDETLRVAAAYAQTLAVPARAAVYDEQVQTGEALFDEIGCAGCHVSQYTTSTHIYPALENQEIRPYTDLLLHDMGEALADNRPDNEASGSEWRTSALWGIGLAQVVLPYSGFLHDGRARTLEEAILWHGGEADNARNAFKELPEQRRESVLRFLYSL